MLDNQRKTSPFAPPSTASLKLARMGLRPLEINSKEQHRLPEPDQIFAQRQEDKAWDTMDPCRVSPVWNKPPELASLNREHLCALQAGLAKRGHAQAKLTPMLAGYSGAQPFSLQSIRGKFFVKAVMGDKDAQSCGKLAKEFVIGKALAAARVTAQFDTASVFEHGSSPQIAFFVSSLLPAQHLVAEPFRSELLTLAAEGRTGRFLDQLTHLLRGFHHTAEPCLLGLGPWARTDLHCFNTVIAHAHDEGVVGGHEQEALQAYQDRIVAAYARRGSKLAKNQVFAHGDLHASNVRFDELKQQLFAIDFGDSGLGDPAREIAYFLFMMDVPMRLAAPLVRLYQREVTPYNEAFYERSLLALASERITRYVKILGWAGPGSQGARDYQRRIEEDLVFVSGWL
jgi:aminoglycoside phosphotransferase (APT) family kinase protein